MNNTVFIAMDKIDQERDQICREREAWAARRDGSHLDVEGSTGEGEFLKFLKPDFIPGKFRTHTQEIFFGI